MTYDPKKLFSTDKIILSILLPVVVVVVDVVLLVVLGVVVVVVVVLRVVGLVGLVVVLTEPGLTALIVVVVGRGRTVVELVVVVPSEVKPGHNDQKPSGSLVGGVSKLLSPDSLVGGLEVATPFPVDGTVTSSVSELTGGKSEIPGRGFAITPESGTASIATPGGGCVAKGLSGFEAEMPLFPPDPPDEGVGGVETVATMSVLEVTVPSTATKFFLTKIAMHLL